MEKKNTSKMVKQPVVQALIAVATRVGTELMRPDNLIQVTKEMTIVLQDSQWMLLILLSIVLLELHVIIALSSWMYVIFKTKFINKKEDIIFKSLKEPVYKTRLVWMKIFSLTACFFVAKTGVETMHFLIWLIDTPTGPTLEIVFEIIIKWLAFIQYFTFYRVYLYVWKAMSSYLNPLIQRKINPQSQGKSTKKSE